MTKELSFYLSNQSLNLKSLMWLMAVELDSAALINEQFLISDHIALERVHH